MRGDDRPGMRRGQTSGGCAAASLVTLSSRSGPGEKQARETTPDTDNKFEPYRAGRDKIRVSATATSGPHLKSSITLG
jgi:hypothetical protein